MNSFYFFFALSWGDCYSTHILNLSKALQDKTCSAAEGQKIADMVVHTLLVLRSDNSFDIFWLKMLKRSEPLEPEPELPCKCRRPKRYEKGEVESKFHNDPKAYFRQNYFEAIDLVVNSIKHRLQQPGYEAYSNLELLLLKVSIGEDILDFVCQFYQDDFQHEILQAQLLTFGVDFQQAKVIKE